MAVINDSAENQFLKDNLVSTEYWVGLKENCDRDGFIWVNDTDMSYDNWKAKQPNDVNRLILPYANLKLKLYEFLHSE